jgi:Tfp pilus assembly protein PilF
MRTPPSLLLGVVLVGSLGAQGLKLHVSLSELEARARQDSNDAAAQYDLGLGYWAKKRYDDAERALRVSVTIEPRYAPSWLALGTLPHARRPKLRREMLQGKVPPEWRAAAEESDRNVRRAFLIDPLVDLQILGAVDPPEPVTIGVVGGRVVVFQNPFSAFQTGHYDLAFMEFDAMMYRRGAPIPRDSVPGVILWYHGLSAAHLNRFDVAILDLQALLDRALAREHGDSLIHVPLGTNDFRYVLALMETRANRVDEAMRLFRDVLTNDLGLYMAHVQLYRIFQSQQRWDSAVVESRAAVETNPEDPTILSDHGFMLIQAGNASAAADTLRRAMAADPRDSRIPFYLGIAEQQLHDTAAARAAFERFLSLAPSRYDRFIRDARERLATLH